MCIGLWSLEHPDYALILCTNRDEYLSRPTENAHFHSFGHEGIRDDFVLSGLDLQCGGTWFGINRAGHIALLTNINEQIGAHHKESRGHLVSSFLLPGAPDAEQFVQMLKDDPSADYPGFNLLLLSPSTQGQTNTLTYKALLITNSEGGGTITSRPLLAEERRIGGVSNGVDRVNEGTWPKVKTGEDILVELLNESHTKASQPSDYELSEQLFEILSLQSSPAPTNRYEMRTSIEVPPVCLRSNCLSPKSDSNDEHDLGATRLSTILLVGRDGRVLFIERDVWKLDGEGKATRGDPREARMFRFTLDGFKEVGDDLKGKGND